MKLIQIDPRDNVAVALEDLKAGTTHELAGSSLTLGRDTAFGHKVALADIPLGAAVLKYGCPIGHATADIPAGEAVHTHNLKTNLSGLGQYAYHGPPPKQPRQKPAVFDGYLRETGEAGTRNELWILPTVGCVNTTAQLLAQRAKARFGGCVDDILALPHNMGCSQLGDDQQRTMRLLAGLAHNPNAGGVLVLSLGCENNNLEVFTPILGDFDRRRVRFLVTQEVGDELEAAMGLVEELVAVMAGDRRQPLSAEKLSIGFKCGGSDGFSGITANALCGRVTDRLTACGGTVVLTEVPEMFGAETQLMARAQTEAVFQNMVEMINGFKQYFLRHGQPISENPSPGNKAGGISTMEEKSLGCIQKGGHAPVVDVLDYADPIRTHGLNLLTGSGNDQVSCTNLAASGVNLIIFTTGRGNPFGAPVPTIKLSSNTALAQHKPHWIDYDAGTLLTGTTFENATEQFFQYILDVASGGQSTNNERYGYKEISIFRDGVIL